MLQFRKLYANFYPNRGSSWEENLVVRNSSHLPVDITGYTITAQARPNIWSNEFIDLDVEITDPDAGQFRLGLSWEDAGTLVHGSYVYDVSIMKNDSSERHKVYEGLLVVSGQVTFTPDTSSSSSSSDTSETSSSSSS